MYYIPSAPIPKVPQTPSLLRVISYGTFLCDRTHSLLSHSTGTGYLAAIPLRLIVATLSQSEQCTARLIVRADRYKELLDDSESLDSPAASRGDLAISMSSWRSLSFKTRTDSLLVDMLVPDVSQKTLAYITFPGTCDDDMEVEVTRNALFDASLYTETFLNTREENFIYDDSHAFEPRLDVETWPCCSVSQPRNFVSIPDIISADASISASVSSFFETLLASSSFLNLNDAECLPVNPDTSTSMFACPVSSSRVASFDSIHDDSQLNGIDLCSTKDFDYDISLQFYSAVPLGVSFELDFPLLPSPSDAAEFIAESSGLPAAEEVPFYSAGSSFKIHLDTELSSQASHVNIISLASFSSAQSFMIPTLSTMENLMHISLDTSTLFIDPSTSLSSLSSIRSLCPIPTCASVEDLMRVQPPACSEVQMEADNNEDDAFDPLPPGIPSPFHISDRLNVFKENLKELRYMHHSLPCLEEERV